jgi:Fe-S-cluster containining protein
MGGCTARCCLSGVYVDVRERDRVLAHADAVRRHMDPDQVKDPARWFATRTRRDPDFPSGVCVGTRVHRGRCVFLNGRGLCVLQLASAAEALPQLKPYFCRLFPLCVADGVVVYDDLCAGAAGCCTFRRRGARPVLEACRAEFELALGAEGYAELRRTVRALGFGGREPGGREAGGRARSGATG